MNSYLRTLALAKRATINYATKRPFCVSFEITHCCNAKCDHCHRGGVFEEKRATPAELKKAFDELKPVTIQISGGEPLLRKDVYEIIEALRQPEGWPFMVFVTNGALLTPDKYDKLCRVGIDAYSVSLDYPDERHDEFRQIKGLFQHLKDLIKDLGPERARRITFNSVVQGKNFREMIKMARLARDLGVSINFSPYTFLRTQDMDYMIQKQDIPEFRELTGELMAFKQKYNTVRTTSAFFADMAQFFENESIPDCRAGERFLVVNPDATFSPCGLIITDYPSWSSLKEGFTKTNKCTQCHTCIRSSTEKPIDSVVRGGISYLFT